MDDWDFVEWSLKLLLRVVTVFAWSIVLMSVVALVVFLAEWAWYLF